MSFKAYCKKSIKTLMKNKNVRILKFNPSINYLGQGSNLVLRKGSTETNMYNIFETICNVIILCLWFSSFLYVILLER